MKFQVQHHSLAATLPRHSRHLRVWLWRPSSLCYSKPTVAHKLAYPQNIPCTFSPPFFCICPSLPPITNLHTWTALQIPLHFLFIPLSIQGQVRNLSHILCLWNLLGLLLRINVWWNSPSIVRMASPHHSQDTFPNHQNMVILIESFSSFSNLCITNNSRLHVLLILSTILSRCCVGTTQLMETLQIGGNEEVW